MNDFRIGHGYDVHKLTEGRKLIIGGVEIPHTLGLLGHSDADVLIHALMDAMLGALAFGGNLMTYFFKYKIPEISIAGFVLGPLTLTTIFGALTTAPSFLGMLLADKLKIKFKGYAFQIEMKFTAHQCGFKIAEVPVIFVNRELGTSKMNSSIFGEAFFGVIQLKLDSWFRKYPQKA